MELAMMRIMIENWMYTMGRMEREREYIGHSENNFGAKSRPRDKILANIFL